MSVSTYSFTDINATISHPSYGSYTIQGEGIGDLTISKATDRSSHDIASDGSVMVSKIAGNNGNVSINAQQTSSLHSFLQGMFNYLWLAETNEWAQISITVKAPNMNKTYFGTGGSFTKEPDEPFQAQGQRVSWNILFADIQRLPI